MVVRDSNACRNLRNEIQKAAAWYTLLAIIRAETKELPHLSDRDQRILHHLVQRHCLNPSPALAVCQVLHESCRTALTGGGGTGMSETLLACVKAVLWQKGDIVAQNLDHADSGSINLGKRRSGPEGDEPPRSCLLVAAPSDAQVDNLSQRLHEESYYDEVFRDKVLVGHPSPRLRLRAQRAAHPPGLRSFHEDKMQHTLGRTPACKRTIRCALNSCRVVFATAGMVANRQRVLLGVAPGKPQTRFAFSFADEASRHSIPVGLALAAMGSQCLLCGAPRQLRPYSRNQLPAARRPLTDLKAPDLAWPIPESFKYSNVETSPGPRVHSHF